MAVTVMLRDRPVAAGRRARAMAVRLRRARLRRLLTASVLSAVTVWGAMIGAPLYLAGAGVAVAVGVALTGLAVDPGRWERGSAGERATADVLDRLSPRRWAVWHDLRVPGSRANVDHVVVGRTGVWVIDTKTTRAPVHAHWWGVRFGDRPLDTAAVRWEADVVAGRLAARTGRAVAVRPLVAVHGDGIGPRGGRAGGVKVVAAGSVADHVSRGRRRLPRSERSELAEAVEGEFGIRAP